MYCYKRCISFFQENPYELQAAMEQQLRLEHNGSMDHQVIIHIHIEKHQVIPNALIILLVICDHDGFPGQRISTYYVSVIILPSEYHHQD